MRFSNERIDKIMTKRSLRVKKAGYKVEAPAISKDGFDRTSVKISIKSAISGSFSLNSLNTKCTDIAADIGTYADNIVDAFPKEFDLGYSFDLPEADDLVLAFKDGEPDQISTAVYFYPHDPSEENLNMMLATIQKIVK